MPGLKLQPTHRQENNHAQQCPNCSIESCGLSIRDRLSVSYGGAFSACACQLCDGTGIESTTTTCDSVEADACPLSAQHSTRLSAKHIAQLKDLDSDKPSAPRS